MAAAQAATAHLIAMGRQRIAAIGNQPQLTNDTGRQRLLGYRQALRAAGRPVDNTLEVAVPTLHRTDGFTATTTLLHRKSVPDAVFRFTDELALGALRATADAGLRVPADVALAGFDDIEDGRFSVPTLTTIAPDKQGIATACPDLLTERMSRPERPGREIVVGHQLLVRQSTSG